MRVGGERKGHIIFENLDILYTLYVYIPNHFIQNNKTQLFIR